MKDKYDTLMQESRNQSMTASKQRNNHNIVSDHSISVERFIVDQSTQKEEGVESMRVLLQQTRRENQELRQKTDIINMSGFETTQKAFSDKVHELNDFIKEKDKNTHQLKDEINNLREENDRLNEELSMCKKLHKTGIATKNGWVTESIDEEI